MKYIREKKVRIRGQFLDVDLYEMDDGQISLLQRAQRKRISPPHTIAANDRHSRNNLRQLIMHNFGAGDYYLTGTYAGDSPPLAEALKQAANFITRLKRLYAKYGVELRAIYVTEGGKPKEDGTGYTRVHHHLVVNAGVPREEIEACWRGRQSGDAEYRRGYCNASIIQPGKDERGCERIAEYMAKSRTKNLGKGLHRWNATRNIKRPIETILDNKLSRRGTAELLELVRAQNAAKQEKTEQLRRILEKRYDRELLDVISTVNPITGRVYISARFKKRDESPPN